MAIAPCTARITGTRAKSGGPQGAAKNPQAGFCPTASAQSPVGLACDRWPYRIDPAITIKKSERIHPRLGDSVACRKEVSFRRHSQTISGFGEERLLAGRAALSGRGNAANP